MKTDNIIQIQFYLQRPDVAGEEEEDDVEGNRPNSHQHGLTALRVFLVSGLVRVMKGSVFEVRT
jgi:hypothetical protein